MQEKVALRRGICRLVAVGEALGAASIAAIALVVLYDVTARALGYPTLWALEVSGYLLVGASVLAAGEVLQKDGHFDVRLFVDLLPPRSRAWIDRAVLAASAVFVVAVAGGSISLVTQTYEFGFRSPTLLRVPLILPQSVLCAGLLLLSLAYLLRLYEALRSPRGPESTGA